VLNLLRRVLEKRHARLWVLLLSALIFTPALGTGLMADDYIHSQILRGGDEVPGFVRPRLDLFRFTTPETTGTLVADGILPWWSDPDARFAFFRPLSALTHWVDYALWPSSPWLMHAHSILWAVIAAAVVGALYRRLLSPAWLGVLALALYALDDARAPAVGWIANRNAPIAVALSMGSVLLYVHSLREPQVRWRRVASPALFALSLFAGEGAVAAGAYLLSAALCLDHGALGRRLLRLLPHVVLGLLWLILARSLGYGVEGSGEYLDPFRDPAAFWLTFPERFAALSFAQLTGAWAEWWNGLEVVSPSSKPVVLVLALSVFGAAAWVFSPLVSQSETARFFGVGALLALVPAATAFPADRLLGWVAVGAFGLIAEYLGSVASGEQGRGARFIAPAMLVAHLVFAPLFAPGRAYGLAPVRELFAEVESGVPSDPSIAQRTVVFVNPPSDVFVCFLPSTRAAMGVPRAKTQRALATGAGAVDVKRLDARTLRITSPTGYVAAQSERMYRSLRNPFRPGDETALPGMRVRVVDVTADGRPRTVDFIFEHELEHAEYVWLAWRDRGYVPFELPQVGGALHLPRVDMTKVIMGDDHILSGALKRLGVGSSGD
jgi:hypothetical protein